MIDRGFWGCRELVDAWRTSIIGRGFLDGGVSGSRGERFPRIGGMIGGGFWGLPGKWNPY
jgi:hypothetical protein